MDQKTSLLLRGHRCRRCSPVAQHLSGKDQALSLIPGTKKQKKMSLYFKLSYDFSTVPIKIPATWAGAGAQWYSTHLPSTRPSTAKQNETKHQIPVGGLGIQARDTNACLARAQSSVCLPVPKKKNFQLDSFQNLASYSVKFTQQVRRFRITKTILKKNRLGLSFHFPNPVEIYSKPKCGIRVRLACKSMESC